MNDKVSKSVAYWLLIGAFLVVSMVILGGYTRLSHSGLSMVSWKPVTGWLPPMSDQQWIQEFEQYKTSPEYIKRNYDFNLEEFKQIYWPEFYHRLLGRVIGVVFLVPFLFFLIRGKLKDKKLRLRLIIIFFLGGLQGFIGWYMVKSGLVDRPDVSHYRLALHLSTALLLFGYLLWTAMGLLYPERAEKTEGDSLVRKLLYTLFGVVSLQIIYGAFVAGLKAGKFYPTFPKMGDDWVPYAIEEAIGKSGFISFLESPFVVQFMHRWIAVIVAVMVIFLFLKGLKMSLTSLQRKGLLFLFIALIIQFTLGVLTIVNLTPIFLGVVHQLGAVVLLSAVLISIYSFRAKKA
ncbi:MAG: COX15/CtaA family protein [Flavobacteriales bacterium]|nr:COX15/CtaA family protein [Flavobacteriales bacterium]